MKAQAAAGYRELEHGSDAALEAWAPDLPELFQQAALGMLALMGVESTGDDTAERSLTLKALDDESLLVAFLSRLLFFLEQERLIFSVTGLTIGPGRLEAGLSGRPLRSIQREIKAVTFNDLDICQAGAGLKVIIVFDL
jgi:SHS2 domain-containing protein